MSRFLVVDVNFMLWRAFYGLARFDPAAAARDACNEVRRLEESFGAPLYCFDLGPYRRLSLLPTYKQKRGESSGDADREAAKAELRRLAIVLADDLRGRVGARRVFCYSGYEADDHAAAICLALPKECEAVVCSRDRDLFQVLRPRVRIYDPVTRVTYTHKDFRTEFGIHPTEWPRVKALAGCNSDEVPGVAGVADKTAAKFVAGALNEMSAKSLAVREFMKTADYQRNLALCTLPFPGTPPIRPETFQ